jgi:hypothetical protein
MEQRGETLSTLTVSQENDIQPRSSSTIDVIMRTAFSTTTIDLLENVFTTIVLQQNQDLTRVFDIDCGQVRYFIPQSSFNYCSGWQTAFSKQSCYL